MFETEEFKRLIASAISGEASRSGLLQFETAIVDFLQRLATQNEKFLMDEELTKPAGSRRGTRQAVESAIALASDASTYAVRGNRKTLTLQDIELAYQDKFCQVWPFCK